MLTRSRGPGPTIRCEHGSRNTANQFVARLRSRDTSGKTAASKTAYAGSIPAPCAILYLRITTDEVIWSVSYEESGGVSMNVYKTNASLANAAAAMWLYLKENNLLP